jgi:gliding motility-associated-like protein
LKLHIFLAFLLWAPTLQSVAQVTLSANSQAGCTPLGVVISVTQPANASTFAWTITRPDGTTHNAATSTYVAILSMPGTYDVQVTVNGNVTSVFNDYIIVYARPTASFSVNDPEGCWPLCVQFTPTSTPGDGAIVQHSWDFGNGTTSTSPTPEFCYPSAGNFSPVYSIADIHGCVSDVTMPGLIQVTNNFPNASISLSESITCNAPVQLSITNSSTGNGTLSTTWDFGNGTSAVQNNSAIVQHTYISSGSYNVCALVTDAVGCGTSTCRNFTILENIESTFTASPNVLCANNTATFQNTNSPTPTGFDWDMNGDGNNDASTGNSSFLFATPGTYHPTLTIHYGNNCSVTSTQNTPIQVLPELIADFMADTTSGCSLPFDVSFTNTSQPSGNVTYEWLINGAVVSTAQHLHHTFDAFGNYTVQLIARNNAGCEETLVRQNYISIAPPSITFNTPNTLCTEEIVEITSFSLTSPDSIATWSWDFDGDGVEDSNLEIPDYTYSQTGTYEVSLSVTTYNGCTAQYTRPTPVLVQTQVSTSFTASSQVSCAGLSIEFCVLEQPGNTYSWDFGDDTGWQLMSDDDICLNHDYQDTGYFSVTLTVFNGACNATTVYENFIYITPPVALFDFNIDCSNPLEVQFGDQSIGAEELIWDFGDGTSVNNETNPTHTYATNGVYTVTLTAINNAEGCPDVATNVVTLVPPSAALEFSSTQGCPPLIVGLNSPATNNFWDISVSNGAHVTIRLDTEHMWWVVSETGPGTSNDSTVFAYTDSYWPDIAFNENGCYDFTVSVIDANGCVATAFYDDAVCVAASPNFADFDVELVNVCDSVAVRFTPQSSGLVGMQWDFGNGQTSSEYNPLHVYLPPYQYGQPLVVTLSAQDAQGCFSSVSHEIDVHFPAIPQFVVTNNPSCLGDVVNFLNFTSGPAVGYSWNFDDPASGAQNTATTFNASHVFVGDEDAFNVCLSADNGHGCVRTVCDDEAVFIANPHVNFSYTSTITNCLFGVSFTNNTPGNETNIHWDFGDDQHGTGQTTYHTYPIGVYDVTLTVTNNYGCTDSVTLPDILNFGNVIGPYSQILDSTHCAPFTASFQAFNPNDTFFTYFWDFDDGSGDPSGSTTTQHSYLTPGTYCPSIIMTDPNGCNALIYCEEPIVVEEFTMAYAVPDYICFQDTLSFSVSNADSYTWNPDPAISDGGGEGLYLLHPTSTTAFVLTGFLDDCVRTDTIEVVVRELPSVTLSIDTEVCHQDAVFGLYGGLPSGATGQYLVNGEPSLIFDPSQHPNTLYPIQYQYTDEYGCTSSALSGIFIHALPVVTLELPSSSCADVAMVGLSGGLPAGGFYQWQDSIIAAIEPATWGYGNHPIAYTFTDQYGCLNTATEYYTVHPLPALNVHYPPLCTDEALVVSNQSTLPSGSIVSFDWIFSNLGTFEGANPNNIRYDAHGTYEVNLVATTNAGCSAQFDSTLRVNATPRAQFTAVSGCQNDLLVFSESSTLEEGIIVSTTWWVENQYIESDDTLHYAFQHWGTQPVFLMVESDDGCNDTLQTSVLIYPQPLATISTDQSCLGTPSSLFANASIPSGGIVEYLWDIAYGLDSLVGPEPVYLFDTAGVYPVSVQLTSNMGCMYTAESDVRVYPLPSADFVAQENTLCEGDAFIAEDLSDVPFPHTIVQWRWYLGNELISQQPNPNVIMENAGLWDVQLVVTSEVGCVGDTTLVSGLQVNPSPVAGFDLSNEEVTMDAPFVQVSNTASADVVNWEYDFGDGTTESFASGDHFYMEWGEFTIVQTVTNTFGCTNRTEATIDVVQAIQMYVPNAFTPDDNGNNDTFKPVLAGDEFTLYHLMIFDRWGHKVFETKDPAESWNGKYFNTGELLTDGSYTWRIEKRGTLNASIEVDAGSVILLK